MSNSLGQDIRQASATRLMGPVWAGVTVALGVASVLSINCSPHVAGPWICGGVHDGPVRRLLAWLLTLSAWEAAEPTSQRVLYGQRSAFGYQFCHVSVGVRVP
jgi:hypothetical protein